MYVVLDQSPAVAGTHGRMRPGPNQLALVAPGRDRPDAVRADRAARTVVSLENAELFEVELVAP